MELLVDHSKSLRVTERKEMLTTAWQMDTISRLGTGFHQRGGRIHAGWLGRSSRKKDTRKGGRKEREERHNEEKEGLG